MAEEVKLPALGESVEEGIVLAWLVEVGDVVEVDQPLLEISTDKIDTEIPSPVAGVVTEIRAEVDDTINVGQVICVVDPTAAAGTGAAPAAPAPAAEEAAAPAAEAAAPAPAAAPAAPAAPAPSPAPASPAPAASTKPSGGTGTHDYAYDLVVLGAGTGGYSCALRAAQLGLKVAIVEKAKVGGTCLHWGCIPTKAILQSAEVAEHAQEAHEYGVTLDYQGIEVAQVNKHKSEVVDKMWKGLQGALKGRGVETFIGTGMIGDRHTVIVMGDDGPTELTAKSLVIATGSTPRELPFARFDGTNIISSDHALFLDHVPASAVVLGSGAVGMEFATAWSAFGTEVTIVELEDRLLPLEDADSSKEIGRAFRKRKGIEAMTGVKLTSVETGGPGVICTIETPKGEQKVEAEVLLVAVGRAPVTEGAGLDNIGLETDRGFINVDEYCRTSVEGVYAVGDVIPTLGLAHASFAEGMLVAEQLAGLDVIPIDYDGVPKVTYSHPEVASVGLTEAIAKERGFDVVVEKYPFQALGRAAMMKASGMVKIIAVKDPSQPHDAGKIIGIHMVGPRATDLISEGQLIYNWEALPSDVAQFIHAHPSFGEAIGEASMALAGRGLHG